jgi:amidohydrolase
MMSTTDEIQLTPFHDWLVTLRRHFHQYPELAYKEEKTAAKIAEVLTDLRVSFRGSIAKTGIVAVLEAQSPGPTVGLRADMDALPLEEGNTFSFRSRHPGIMHACGHDGHITIVLGVIRSLLDCGWPANGRGRLLFFFQPAEEGGAGAKAMIDAGVLDDERMEAVFAGHLYPELPVGHVGMAPDVSNAASDNIRIRLTGRGGHGAQPHLCVDPIVAGASLVMQAQTLISRTISPTDSAVFTIGQFHAGTARNIIPESAELDATLRTLRQEVRDGLIERLQGMLRGVENAHRVSTELNIYSGYPLLVNDERLVKVVTEAAEKVLGPGCAHLGPARMGSEDFAYFLQHSPGVLVRLGSRNPESGVSHGLHSPHFDMDERVLDVGVRLFSQLLMGYGDRPQQAVSA